MNLDERINELVNWIIQYPKYTPAELAAKIKAFVELETLRAKTEEAEAYNKALKEAVYDKFGPKEDQ